MARYLVKILLIFLQLYSDVCFVVFALFNCVWATTYLELWKRKQAELAFKWGTFSIATDPILEDPRPAYKVRREDLC
jgi:hypothetical protein